MVVRRHLHVGLEIGVGDHTVDPVLEAGVVGKADGVGVGVRVADEAGEHVHPIVLRRGVDIERGVLGIILRVGLILLEACEHGAVVHVVAVNDGVGVAEIPVVLEIHEQGAAAVVAAVDEAVQVVVVVGAADHGVVDDGVFAEDPADDVAALGEETVEVHIDGGGLHLHGRLLLRGLDLKGGCSRRRRRGCGGGRGVGYAVVAPFRLLVFMHDAV